MGGGLASFFAPLRGTNPPCIRLPASVRSDNAPCHSDNPPSPFALRTPPFGIGPSPFGAENGRTGLAREGGNRVRAIWATRPRSSNFAGWAIIDS